MLKCRSADDTPEKWRAQVTKAWASNPVLIIEASTVPAMLAVVLTILLAGLIYLLRSVLGWLHARINRRIAVVAGCFVVLPLFPHKAEGQFVAVVSDPPVESMTFAMHMQQLLQYVQEAATALSTYQHLQLMIREVQQLVTHPSTNIAMDLATFSSVLAQSQAIAMNVAQMDATFQNNFAPYSPTPLMNYAVQYNQWANTALRSIHASANAAGYQGNMLQNEQGWMSQVNLMNQAPNGMDQSLQINNSIGLETVAQLQKLRMLMISDIGQQAVMSTTMLNTQQAALLSQQNALTDTGTTADQRGW
jgi:P-type conjugative transfer protein TrbJ